MSEKKPRRRVWRWLLLLIALALALLVWWRMSRPTISPERLAAVPLILQGDYEDTVAVFAGEDKSVKTSGCGAVSLSMAIEYLTGRAVSPQVLFEWAVEHEYYFGDGLSHEALTDMARLNGVKGTWIANEPKPVLRALKAGRPVIAHMGPGTFTAGGHYILLRGVDADGRILVNDPSSRERSEVPYDMALIMAELRRENSFLVLTK